MWFVNVKYFFGILEVEMIIDELFGLIRWCEVIWFDIVVFVGIVDLVMCY